MAKNQAPTPAPKGGGSNRGTLVALVFVVVLVGVLYWGIQAIVQHNALQNCLDSGRRDCAPLSGAP